LEKLVQQKKDLEEEKSKRVELDKLTSEIETLKTEIKNGQAEYDRINKKTERNRTSAEKDKIKKFEEKQKSLKIKEDEAKPLQDANLKTATEYEDDISAKQKQIDEANAEVSKNTSTTSSQNIDNLQALLNAAETLSSKSSGKADVDDLDKKLTNSLGSLGTHKDCAEINKTCSSCKDKAKRYNTEETKRIDEILKAK
jgi:hypothetical protein